MIRYRRDKVLDLLYTGFECSEMTQTFQGTLDFHRQILPSQMTKQIMTCK